MKNFSATLTQRSKSFNPSFHEEIEGDDLLEILSKLILTIARLHKKILDEQYERNVKDDDIPF